jgi:plasmid maintenance system antidote protein VapI
MAECRRFPAERGNRAKPGLNWWWWQPEPRGHDWGPDEGNHLRQIRSTGSISFMAIALPLDTTTATMPTILRAIVLENGHLTVTKAAKKLHISRTALSRVLTGNADLSVELAAMIEDIYGYSALDLLQYQVARKLAEYRENIPH